MDSSAEIAGPLAESVLKADRFRIVAVFRRSLYLQAQNDGGVCCLGSMALERGPLNVLCDPWEEDQLPETGSPVYRRGTLLEGAHVRLRLDRMRRWAIPEACSSVPGNAQRSLDVLRGMLACQPRAGLIRLFVCGWRPVEQEALMKMALPAILCLREGLQARLGGSGRTDGNEVSMENGVSRLLGLGPGLTPSGDDFLGGVLIGLHRLRQTETARCLAGIVRRHAEATHLISRAHLFAAAQGMGAEGLHRFVEALLAGDTPDMTRIDRIGHSSGWDAVSGVCLALEAFLQSHAVSGC